MEKDLDNVVLLELRDKEFCLKLATVPEKPDEAIRETG